MRINFTNTQNFKGHLRYDTNQIHERPNARIIAEEYEAHASEKFLKALVKEYVKENTKDSANFSLNHYLDTSKEDRDVFALVKDSKEVYKDSIDSSKSGSIAEKYAQVAFNMLEFLNGYRK